MSKNNVLVYCELSENNEIADISLELCTKGRQLASQLQGRLQAVVAGHHVDHTAKTLFPYGVDDVFMADDPRLSPYRTLPHFSVVSKLIEQQQPGIVLFGASSVGRDLAPRISSYLRCGLTADCTSLEIGSHTDAKTQKVYDNILLQIRPAFGGNIIATIVTPETLPQMATVREGVMKKEIADPNHSRFSAVRLSSSASTSRVPPSSWPAATVWAARRTSSCFTTSPTSSVAAWAPPAPRSTPASASPSAR